MGQNYATQVTSPLIIYKLDPDFIISFSHFEVYLVNPFYLWNSMGGMENFNGPLPS